MPSKVILVELKKIQYFLRIVEKGSLSKAAESLYLTQPTLSRFLAKLEEETGTKLFFRGKQNSLELTECGQKYYETAKKIDALWTGLEAELSSHRSSIVGKTHIFLGIDGDHLYPFAFSCAEQVMKQYPELSIHISCHNSLEIPQHLIEGTLDLAILSYSEMDERLVYLLDKKTEVDLVVSKANPLAAQSYQLPGQENRRVTLQALPPNTPFLLMKPPAVLRQETDQYMKKLKYEPNVMLDYVRHASVPTLISSNKDLVGFCPRNNRSEQMAYLALDPPFYVTRGICYRQNAELCPAEQALIALLKKRPKIRSLD